MTKAYTLVNLIKEVASIRYSANADQVVTKLSPRKGRAGLKIYAINNFLGGLLPEVFDGTVTGLKGTSARTRLLRALRIRKKNGFF